MYQTSFIVRYLSHPVMGTFTIALLALLVASLALFLLGHATAGVMLSMVGTIIITSGFGCYALWHWMMNSKG